MARVKGGTVARQRRKKILKLAKGYYGAKHILFRTANEQVMKSLRYAYRDRKQLKREMRKLWIARINAGARMCGISYSKLMHGLKLAEIDINRKMLSELAIHDFKVFESLVEQAKAALNGTPVKKETVKEVKVEKKASEVETKVTASDDSDLSSMTVTALKALAKEKSISGYSTMKKQELIEALSK